MKTAVDQLIEKMSLEDVCKYSNELAEAKEMEKEQHCRTYINAMKECMINPLGDELYQINAESYYNETFKQQEQ
jgi:L-serine deaminase